VNKIEAECITLLKDKRGVFLALIVWVEQFERFTKAHKC